MTGLIVILSLTTSLAALAFVAGTDPKRRRVFGLSASPRSSAITLVDFGAVAAPGALLLIIGHGSGFVVWLGAISLIGWFIAASPPRSPRLSEQKNTRGPASSD